MAGDILIGGFERREIVVMGQILPPIIISGISFARLQSLAGTRGKSHPSSPLVAAFIKQASFLSV